MSVEPRLAGPKMHLKLVKAEQPLVRRVIYTQWFLLAFTIILEAMARSFARGEKWHIDVCLAILAVLAMMSIHWPDKKPLSYRLVFIFTEMLLITAASAIGLTRWTWPLYLALIARAAVLMEGRYLWMTVGVAFMTQESWYLCKWLVGQPLPGLPYALVTSLLAAFVLTGTYGALMVVVGWLMQTLLTEQRLRQETERLGAENEALAMQLERTRIAREIHDTLGHSLTSLKIQLELSKRLLEVDSERARSALEQAEQLAARSLMDTRVALQSVRNADFNFNKALGQLIDEANINGKIAIATNVEPVALPNAVSYQLYRVVQESLTNTMKHASAKNVTIEICSEGTDVALEIRDDGRGFDGKQVLDGFGLQGMRERIASVKGKVEVVSEPDQGTCVRVRVPREAVSDLSEVCSEIPEREQGNVQS